ncbi:MAG: PspA/IM30 family protein [Bacteroidota bacterium]
MNFFSRIFKMGQAEAHSALDSIEDPIKLTEQGIRDLKKDLDKSLQSLAEVKAMAIRSNHDYTKYKNMADDYEKKAMMLLQRAENGDLDANEADRLASESLMRKEENVKLMATSKEEKARYDQSVAQLEGNVKTLKSNISHWENELKTLKARHKVSTATKNLNKQLSKVDTSGTVSMLEKMKDKVAQEEALAQSYGEIANEGKSVDDEIDRALADSPKAAASDALAELKAKMAKKSEG